MAQQDVTIEVYFDGRWRPAAELTVVDTDAGASSPTRVAYLDDFIVSHIDALGTRDGRSISEQHAVSFDVWTHANWPAFLHDIVPSGAARSWWRRRLASDHLTEKQLNFVLLRDHTVAPIGHLRIAGSGGRPVAPIPFTKEEVCRRANEFLEHAAELGAAIGGATGAGGDAPKVLLAEDAEGNVYPDAALADDRTAACWLVKWPRGRDTARDRLVLRAEYLYAHVLADIGLDTRPGEWRENEDGKPSLWLPRFDRVVLSAGLQRLPVESFYSLAGVTEPGAVISHQRFLESLARALQERGRPALLPDLLREYVCRDLLDVVLGNADNHGRNRAVLRDGELRLAPIYDLAPMVMDPEGVTRSSRWDTHEVGGRINWRGVCHDLAPWIDPAELEAALSDFGERLMALPDLLVDAGLDDEVMSFPRIHLRHLSSKLRDWGLR